MRRFFTQVGFALGVYLLCLSAAYATDYYVAANGNDGNLGTSPTQAWRSLNKVNAMMSIFRPGDQILFRRGDRFTGKLKITCSGASGSPIRFAAFGTAKQAPIINGFRQLTNWESLGSGNWKTAYNSPTGSVRNLFVDGKFQPIGRYPNADAPNGGYLTITQKNGKTITVDGLKGNWAGGDAVIRARRWILKRKQIIQQSGNQLTIADNSTRYQDNVGWGFFVVNHPDALDREGEWAYDAQAQEVYLRSSDNPNTKTIQTAHEQYLVHFDTSDHIVLEGLSMQGAAEAAIYLNTSNSVSVTRCAIYGSGQDGISAQNAQTITLTDNSLDYTNNNAIVIRPTNQDAFAEIAHNTITRTATVAGMGESDDGNYCGITARGNDLYIHDNTVDQTGYLGIGFLGSRVRVEHNYVTNFCLVKDDGGGIYSYTNTKIPGQDITIRHNVVGKAGNDRVRLGTTAPNRTIAYCYYLDGRTSDVDLQDNTAYQGLGAGIYLHNTTDSRITNNHVFDSNIGLLLSYDDSITGSPIRNNTITRNVFFAQDASQEVVQFISQEEDFGQAGVIDSNYYYHPTQPSPRFRISRIIGQNTTHEWYSLYQWQTAFSYDIHSQATPDKRSPLRVDRYLSENLINNGTFDNNLTGWSRYTSNAANGMRYEKGGVDEGRLAIYFNDTSDDEARVAVFNDPGIGSFAQGAQYILTYSLASTKTPVLLESRIQLHPAPYTVITDNYFAMATTTQQEIAQLLTVNKTIPNGRVTFNLPATNQKVYLDNISLRKVLMKPFVAFRVNPSAKQASFSLPEGNWLALGGSTYQDTITLPPFRSAILIPVVEPTTDIWLEAECGTLAPSASFWSQVNQSNASGRVLMQADTAFSGGQQTGREDPRRQLSFSFSLAKAGNYHLFARHTMPSGSGSSFIFRVDNERWWTWETMQTGSLAWQEMVASPFALTAGKHTLTVVNHRQGSQLDKLLLSLDSSLPTGEGSTAGNCSTNTRIASGVKDSLDTPDHVKSKLLAYPNPASTHLMVRLMDDTHPPGVVLLMDLSGRILQQQERPTEQDNNTFRIATQDIPAGMYLLRWQAAQSYTRKVFIKH